MMRRQNSDRALRRDREDYTPALEQDERNLEDFIERYATLQLLAEDFISIVQRHQKRKEGTNENSVDSDAAVSQQRTVQLSSTQLIFLLTHTSNNRFDPTEHPVNVGRCHLDLLGAEPWMPILAALNTVFPPIRKLPQWMKRRVAHRNLSLCFENVIRPRCGTAAQPTAAAVVARCLTEVDAPTEIHNSAAFRRSFEDLVQPFFVRTVKEVVDQVTASQGFSLLAMNDKFRNNNEFSFAACEQSAFRVVERWNECNQNSKVLSAQDVGFTPIQECQIQNNTNNNNNNNNNSFFYKDRVTVLTGPSGVGKTSAALVMARDGTNARAGVCFYATVDEVFGPDPSPFSLNRDVRNRGVVADLIKMMFLGCLGWTVDESQLDRFRKKSSDFRTQEIVDLVRNSCLSSFSFAPFNGNIYIVIDEIGKCPNALRGCCAIVKRFTDAVKAFFKLKIDPTEHRSDSNVYLVAVGTGAENFQLNQDVGSMPESYHIRSIRAQLLYPLLKSYIEENDFDRVVASNDRTEPNFTAASFFVGLFNMLFPNSASTVDVTNIVAYRIRQLGSNSRCAALLIDVIAKLVDSPRLNSTNGRQQQHQLQPQQRQQDGATVFKWQDYDEARIRMALPMVLSSVATRFAALNGLAGVPNKRHVISIALGFSLNREVQLPRGEWNTYATRYGLITDNARWVSETDEKSGYTNVLINNNQKMTFQHGTDISYYCYPSNQPRYQIQEAETSLLLAWLGATDSEMGFASNSTRGWFLFEQLVLDYHSLRTVVPASPSVALAFNQLLESRKHEAIWDVPVKNKGPKFMVAPTFAPPHILFSSDRSHPVEGIYRVHSSVQIEDKNFNYFAPMDMSSADYKKQKKQNKNNNTRDIDFEKQDTWRSAVCNNYAVVIHNADRASGADGIILTKGRVSLVQCKQYESKVLTSKMVAEEFHKMHIGNEKILRLLRRCCRVNDGDDEDSVQVICTIVVSNKDNISLNPSSETETLGRYQTNVIYNTTNTNNNNRRRLLDNVFEFFACERGDDKCPFPFFPFPESFLQRSSSTSSTSCVLDQSHLFLMNKKEKV